MIEFAQGFFNLEHPAANANVPAGRLVLRGWMVGHPTAILTDLRVRCAGRIWPAVYGFIRPDLAAHFKHLHPHLPAAFEALVFLTPGPVTLEFEALDISGHWVPVHTVALVVDGPPAAAYLREAESPISPRDFAELLRYLLRLQAARPDSSIETHASRLVSSLACPRYLFHPSPPFRAFLREPAIITRAAYGRLLVDGYLFHEHTAVTRILGTFDLHVWQTVAHGGPSPIAPQLYPQFAQAVRSDLKGYIEIPEQLPRPVAFRLYAELPDGTRHLCAVQQTFTYGLEDEKKPFPPASPIFFWQATRALRRQLTATGISVSGGAALRGEIWRAWREFSRLAPRRNRGVTSVAPAEIPPARGPLGSILVFTQNLDYEGAPLLLLELCADLIAQGGARLTLVSARDGALRSAFADAGAAVQIVDASRLAIAKTAGEWQAVLRVLIEQVDARGADLVVANTLASYWAVHLAHHAGKPSLFYIHESTTPAAFFHGTATHAAIAMVEASFSLATRVSFNTTSTARYYQPLATHANFHLNPGWINLAALDAHRANHPRESLRTQLGVSPDRLLVVNLGAVCERKGQHVFAWAVDLLWRRHPALAARAEFWMVGGRQTAFDGWMATLIASLGRPNLRIITETPRAYDYLGAADLFVCSSYEESFPRVVLEAMALSVPIVSTNVHGIPSMVTHDRDAWLVAPGDSSALADGLARLLAQPDLARSYAQGARARVVAEFDAALVLPRQRALAQHTIAIHAARH